MSKGKKNVLRAGIISMIVLGLFLFSPPTQSSATVGGYNDSAWNNKFDVTITYDVDNSCDLGGNYIVLLTYDWMHDSYYQRYAYPELGINPRYELSKKAGKGLTKTFEMPAVPGGLYYSIQGDSVRISKYYIKKIEAKVKNPVIDLGLPQTISIWDGEFGEKLAHTRELTPTGLDDPVKVGVSLWLNSDGPVFDPFSDKYGSNKEQTSNLGNCAVDLYGGPRVTGITAMTAPGEISVPKDGGDSTAELTPGVVYDQFGASYIEQKFDISTDKEDTGVTIKYDNKEKKWYVVASSRANAAEDYDVVVSRSFKNGKDFQKSATVRVKTFDYNFKFVDDKGNVVDTLTVDYGQKVTPPNDSYVWLCDDYADWSNTTDGPQDRVVHGVPKMAQSGTKDDPIMINTIDDWNKLNEMVSLSATTGLFYKLGSDLTVNTVLGTQEKPFEGIFDGDGKTLTLDYTADDIKGSIAPFAYTSNAAIRNLNVDGQIKSTNGHAAGIIGENSNWTLILNCRVSATIEGGNCIGGLSVGAGGTLKIENSSFEGKIIGKNDCGGFVAWGTDSLVLRDCIFKPVSGSFIDSGATFANKTYDTLDNCVYYSELGEVQGDPSKECYEKEVKSAKKLTVTGFQLKPGINGKIVAIWKQILAADGYQIQYCADGKFKKSKESKKVTKKKAKAFLRNIKAWKKKNKGRKLFVKIRTYRNIKNPSNGNIITVYGRWSKVRKIVVK